MFGSAGGFGGVAAGGNPSGDQDLTAQGGPSNSISSVCTGMVPAGLIPNTQTPTTVIGCSSWDGKAYVWAVMKSPQGQQPAFQALAKQEWFISHPHPSDASKLFPVLDCCFSPCTDPNNIGSTNFYTGACDNTSKCRILASGQEALIAKHDKPINIVRAYRDAQGAEVLATGSWDGTVKFWELSKVQPNNPNPQPSHAIQLNGQKIFAMDVRYPVLVVGTADNLITVYNLQSPNQPAYPPKASQLSYQLRTIAVFPDLSGYAVGSVEGRVGIQYFQDTSNKSFAFRCHREPVNNNSENLVFPVNSICFHEPCKTFATAGSDGCYHFWDKDSKQCLKKGKKFNPSPNVGIVSGSFSPDGAIYAYATSYDWYKGAQFYDANAKNQVWLRAVQPDDVTPKPAQANNRSVRR